MNAEARNVRSIFLAAVENHAPEQRAAYLDEACEGDEDLRQRVEVLLRAHEQANSLLDRPAPTPEVTVDERPLSERPGTVIGAYKLMEQIGEGGMGLVFVAEQQQPVRRKVALKVIKPGMDTRQVVARFEAERQALALMDHPNIARVHDGGETASARPYFVMELVKGVPITEFCDQNQVSIRERLELFLGVCSALQHAHQKGIIHRDIKPSNVLVTSHDGTPVVKVIDFGIAKAIGQQLTDKTIYTQFAQLVGTPLYMSPEQAGQSGLDVDTRSDIYSLGVLLYQLLTGTTPFDEERLKEVGYDEMRRIIREEEPPRPSTRISTLGQVASTVSMHRKSDPRRLSQVVRGELDWITMKALEKDRNRRYESASTFAADVQRYLADEPVLACPPSAWYRLRKLVRRNKRVLVAALVLSLAVLLTLGSLAWMVRDRAMRQSQTEREVALALTEAETLNAQGWKQMDDPDRWQTTVVLAKSAVQRAEGLLATGMATEEQVDRVRNVRVAIEAAGRDSRLRAELDRIRLETAVVKGLHFDSEKGALLYAAALNEYGINLESPEAGAARVRSSPLRAALLAALEDWARYPRGVAERARLAEVVSLAEPHADSFRARWRQAVRVRDKAVLEQLAAAPEARGGPAAVVVNLARDMESLDDLPAAERLLRAGQRRFPGDFWLNHDLGRVLLGQKPSRADEAVSHLTAALALRPKSTGVYDNLSTAYLEKNDLVRAIRCCQAALELDANCAGAHNNLGNALYRRGEVEAAIREYRTAIRIEPKFALAHSNLGNVLRSRGMLAEAIVEYRAALQIDSKYASAHVNLGIALYAKGERGEAIREYGLAIRGNPKNPLAHFNLAIALYGERDWDGAIREYRAALELDPGLAQAHHYLGHALNNKGKRAEAIHEYRRATEIDPENALARYNLGISLNEHGDPEGAIRELRAALRIDPKSARAHYQLGCILQTRGDLEGAITEYQKTIQIDSGNAEAHCNLGQIRQHQGRFAEAVSYFKTGHKLGSHSKNRRFPFARWVREAEQLLELEAKLAKVMTGASQPADSAERLRLACLCQQPYKQLAAAAARFYADAFAAEPKLAEDTRKAYRYNAACAAALAGCGRGKDADKLDDRERTRLRQQALSWLQADFTMRTKQLKITRSPQAAQARRVLEYWGRDANLACVRDRERLVELPEAERMAWHQLWDGVAQQIHAAGSK
jgi:serine/threonine protein kinase/Tfp pilus assembly protein PilF